MIAIFSSCIMTSEIFNHVCDDDTVSSQSDDDTEG